MADYNSMKRYFAKAPGFGPYAVDIWATDERDARRRYARFLGLSRCPRGTAVWEATD